MTKHKVNLKKVTKADLEARIERLLACFVEANWEKVVTRGRCRYLEAELTKAKAENTALHKEVATLKKQLKGQTPCVTPKRKRSQKNLSNSLKTPRPTS